MDTVSNNNANPADTSQSGIIHSQRYYFNSGATKDIQFRIKQLTTLKKAFLVHEKNLYAAMKSDLNKSEAEAYTTEFGITIAEIEHNLKNIRKWTKPVRVSTPLFFLPAKSYIRYEPYGVALIISPWNYPIKNLFGPLLGAMTAGNCCVLKPSELAPATSSAISKMISEFFKPEYLAVIEGGIPETTDLLKEKFDYILFTGGTATGKIIYEAAAKHLTPVTLELGGKSPAIVDRDINLDVTARRIVWGKFTNAGQTCVAPDYILVHKEIKNRFITRVNEIITEFFGKDPSTSPDFGRIINQKHFERVKNLISGDIITGGLTDASQRYIAPTIIDNVKPGDKVMQEEIFGPVMPLIEYEKTEEAIAFINKGEKPLALYVFSKNKKTVDKILNETSSGGVCINDAFVHLGNMNLPFGGTGNSGMGAYNGKTGFETFSHKRAVLKRSFLFDVKQRYAPYSAGKLGFLKFAMKKLL
ncbi:MAG: aldehyde dehydrogenase [Bacteroidetes bacterium]|nr:aldehyde dehydrogenase [Bacteroidota bacterium]